MLITAKIILTIAVFGYSIATIKADFNKTHATNPAWTPHARFHVVWQILSYAGLACIGLYLIWTGGPTAPDHLYLAAAISIVIYGAFFFAVISRARFGGTLYDENGYPPFNVPFAPKGWKWDANVTAFTVFSIASLLGLVAALVG